MAIEDSFLKVYFLGTQKEIDAYFAERGEKKQKEFNAGFVATGGIGIWGFPYTSILVADSLTRVVYAYLKKDVDVLSKDGIKMAARTPGIVGLIRGFLED